MASVERDDERESHNLAPWDHDGEGQAHDLSQKVEEERRDWGQNEGTEYVEDLTSDGALEFHSSPENQLDGRSEEGEADVSGRGAMAGECLDTSSGGGVRHGSGGGTEWSQPLHSEDSWGEEEEGSLGSSRVGRPSLTKTPSLGSVGAAVPRAVTIPASPTFGPRDVRTPPARLYSSSSDISDRDENDYPLRFNSKSRLRNSRAPIPSGRMSASQANSVRRSITPDHKPGSGSATTSVYNRNGDLSGGEERGEFVYKRPDDSPARRPPPGRPQSRQLLNSRDSALTSNNAWDSDSSWNSSDSFDAISVDSDFNTLGSDSEIDFSSHRVRFGLSPRAEEPELLPGSPREDEVATHHESKGSTIPSVKLGLDDAITFLDGRGSARPASRESHCSALHSSLRRQMGSRESEHTHLSPLSGTSRAPKEMRRRPSKSKTSMTSVALESQSKLPGARGVKYFDESGKQVRVIPSRQPRKGKEGRKRPVDKRPMAQTHGKIYTSALPYSHGQFPERFILSTVQSATSKQTQNPSLAASPSAPIWKPRPQHSPLSPQRQPPAQLHSRPATADAEFAGNRNPYSKIASKRQRKHSALTRGSSNPECTPNYCDEQKECDDHDTSSLGHSFSYSNLTYQTLEDVLSVLEKSDDVQGPADADDSVDYVESSSDAKEERRRQLTGFEKLSTRALQPSDSPLHNNASGFNVDQVISKTYPMMLCGRTMTRNRNFVKSVSSPLGDLNRSIPSPSSLIRPNTSPAACTTSAAGLGATTPSSIDDSLGGINVSEGVSPTTTESTPEQKPEAPVSLSSPEAMHSSPPPFGEMDKTLEGGANHIGKSVVELSFTHLRQAPLPRVVSKPSTILKKVSAGVGAAPRVVKANSAMYQSSLPARPSSAQASLVGGPSSTIEGKVLSGPSVPEAPDPQSSPSVEPLRRPMSSLIERPDVESPRHESDIGFLLQIRDSLQNLQTKRGSSASPAFDGHSPDRNHFISSLSIGMKPSTNQASAARQRLRALKASRSEEIWNQFTKESNGPFRNRGRSHSLKSEYDVHENEGNMSPGSQCYLNANQNEMARMLSIKLRDLQLNTPPPMRTKWKS